MKIKITTKNKGEFTYDVKNMYVLQATKTISIVKNDTVYGFHLDDVEKIEVKEND